MTCASRIATVRAWLMARLLDSGYDRDRASEILGASTIASAGISIHVDFREPPQARALTFEFRGETIDEVSGFDDRPAERVAPAAGELGSPIPV